MNLIKKFIAKLSEIQRLWVGLSNDVGHISLEDETQHEQRLNSNGNNLFLEQIILSYLAVSETKTDARDKLAEQVVELILQAFPDEPKPHKHFNPPYKDITDIIFSKENILLSDSIGNFKINVSNVIESKYNDEKQIERLIYIHDKLVEHTLLAQSQREFIKKSIVQAQITARTAEGIAMTAKKTADKAEETYKTMFANYVTILGIFTAIIVTIFGGLNVINTVTKNSYENTSVVVFLTTLLMFCILLLLYFLANMIAFMKDESNKKLHYIFGVISLVFVFIMLAVGATL